MPITARARGILSIPALLRGEKAVVDAVIDITGSSTIQTGLQSIDGGYVVIAEDPTTGGMWATYTVSDNTTDPGEVVAKVWKPTATGDVTPVAATTACLCHCIFYGTGPA